MQSRPLRSFRPREATFPPFSRSACQHSHAAPVHARQYRRHSALHPRDSDWARAEVIPRTSRCGHAARSSFGPKEPPMNAPDTGVGGTQTGRMSDAPTVGREAFVKEFRERMQGKLPDDKIDAAAEAMTAATTSYVAIMVPITVLVYTRVQVLIHDSKAPTRPQFRGNAGGLIIPPLPPYFGGYIGAVFYRQFRAALHSGRPAVRVPCYAGLLGRHFLGQQPRVHRPLRRWRPRIAIRRWGRRDRLLVTLPNLSQPGSWAVPDSGGSNKSLLLSPVSTRYATTVDAAASASKRQRRCPSSCGTRAWAVRPRR
jgi:hypothetical protein